MKNKNKGFSLIELLATIFLMSLVFGISFYYIGTIQKNSEDKANAIAINSIKKSANLYVQEFSDKIVWQQDGTEKSVCITVNSLREKGYIKKESSTGSYTSIKLTKDNNEVIKKAELNSEDCNKLKLLKIPTCNSDSLIYTGNSIKIASTVVKTNVIDPSSNSTKIIKFKSDKSNGTVTVNGGAIYYDDDGIPSGYVKNSVYGTSAKDYKIKYKPNWNHNDFKGYQWEDGTQEEKTIICTIRKRTPTIYFTPINPQSSQPYRQVGAKEEIKVDSHANIGNKQIPIRGKYSVISGNTKYVKGEITDKDTNVTATTMTITTLATSNTSTNLYVTLNPSDNNNYYSSTKVYTVGTANLKGIAMPTCKNKDYPEIDKTDLVMSINNGKIEPYKYRTSGYTLSGIYDADYINETNRTPDGIYTSIASLKYGYYWKTDHQGNDVTSEKDKFKNITLKCKYPYKKSPTLEVKEVYAVENDTCENCQINNPEVFAITGTDKADIMKDHYVKIKLVSDAPGTINNITIASNKIEVRSSTTSSDGKTHWVVVKALDITNDYVGIDFDFSPSNQEEYYSITLKPGYSLKVIPKKCRVTYDYNYFENNIYDKEPITLSEFKEWRITKDADGNKLTGNTFKLTKATELTAKYGMAIKAEITKTTKKNEGGVYLPLPNKGKLTSGKKYTWSVYIKSKYAKTMKIGSEQGGLATVNVSTTWKRFDHTFTAKNTTNSSFVFYISGSNWGTSDELYIHSVEIYEQDSLNIQEYPNKICNDKLGTLPTSITRTGHTFEGWYTEASGGTQITEDTIVSDSDSTYYAHWKARRVLINYNANGGTISSISGTANHATYTINSGIISMNNKELTTTIGYGAKRDLANLNSRGYLYLDRGPSYIISENKEWCTNANGTGNCYNQVDEYDASALCSEIATKNCNVTLYANWIVVPPTVTLTGTNTLKKDKQTATLKCNDTTTAYYWGTKTISSANAITTTTANDITKLKSADGLTKTINTTGTYTLACKDADGNFSTKSLTYYNYTVNNMFQNVTGSTRSTANYTQDSSNTYIAKKGTSLTLSSIYTIPSHSNSGRFGGYSNGAAGTTAATIASKTVGPILNSESIYSMWFTRNVIYFDFKVPNDESVSFINNATYTWSLNDNNYIVRTRKSDGVSTTHLSSMRYVSSTEPAQSVNFYNYKNQNDNFSISKTGYTVNTTAHYICISCVTANYTLHQDTFKTNNTDAYLCNTESSDCTVHLKVNWVGKKYYIKFDRGFGSNSINAGGYDPDPNPKQCTYGSKCTLPANEYTFTNYAFYKWNTNSDGTGTNYNDKADVNIKNSTTQNGGTVTLHALWRYYIYFSANPRNGDTISETYDDINECNSDGKCGINRYASGSSINDDETYFRCNAPYKSGETITLTSNKFKKYGYDFKCWSTNKNDEASNCKDANYGKTVNGVQRYKNKGSAVNVIRSSSQPHIANLYAIWAPKKLVIVYDCNGGTAGTSSTYTKTYHYDDESPAFVQNCSRSGYTFLRWQDTNGNTYWAENNIADTWLIRNSPTLNVSAMWRKNSTNNKYTVIYNSNGGSGNMTSQECEYGKSCTIKSNTFKKYGYSFNNWKDDKNNNYAQNSSFTKKKGDTAIKNNILELDAQWNPVKITINYDASGATGSGRGVFDFDTTVSGVELSKLAWNKKIFYYNFESSDKSIKKSIDPVRQYEWVLTSSDSKTHKEFIFGYNQSLVLDEEFLSQTSCDDYLKKGMSCALTLCIRWNVDLLVSIQRIYNTNTFAYNIYSGRSWNDGNHYYDIYYVKFGNNSPYFAAAGYNNICTEYSSQQVGPNVHSFDCIAKITNTDTTLEIRLKENTQIKYPKITAKMQTSGNKSLIAYDFDTNTESILEQ